VSLLGGVVILLSLSVGDAFAAAEIRLLNAVPGGPPPHLQVSAARQVKLEATDFGEATEYTATPAGRARLALLAGEKPIAKASSSFEEGARYTVVAVRNRNSEAPQLRVYRDGPAAAGKARLRVVSAAPEVNGAEITLDGRQLGSLSPGEVADYAAPDPGTYRLAAVKPDSEDELAALPGLSLVAGTAASAYLIGSAGERTRFVLHEDAVAAPTVGPATGLGGVAGGGMNWLLAILSAAAAGTLGGLLYSRARTSGDRAGR